MRRKLACSLLHRCRRLRFVVFGATYRIRPVQWGDYVLDIEIVVRDAEGYTIRLHCMQREREKTAEDKGLQQPAIVQGCEWERIWGEGRTLLLPHLTAPLRRTSRKGAVI